MKTLPLFLPFMLFAQLALTQPHTISSIKIHKMSPNSMQLAASATQDFYAMVHTGVDSLVLHHFDQAGNLDWSNRMDRKLQNSFDLITLKDGAVLFAALDYAGNSPSSLFIGKISKNGALLWAKRLDHINGLELGKLTAIEDGFLLSCNVSIGSTIGFLVRFDAAGNLLWDKSFAGMTFGNAAEASGGNIFALAYTNTVGLTHRPKIFKLTADGALLWAKEYDAGHNLDLFTILSTPDNAIVCAGRASDDPFIYPDYWVLKLDEEGAVIWSNTYAYPDNSNIGYTYYYKLRFAPNVGLYLQFSSGSSGNTLLCIGNDGQFQHGWQYPQSKKLTDLENLGSNGLLSIGETFLGNQDYRLSIFRLDSLGRLDACCIDSVFLVGSTQPAGVITIQAVQSSGIQVFQETLSFIPVEFTLDISCDLPSILASEATICPGECATFQALAPNSENPDLEFNWSFVGGSPEQASTDMPGPVCYNLPGHYPVVLSIDEGDCHFEIMDSLEVCSPDFFPTAFTPNGDGANDTFKPLLYFPSTAYHFSIYNRWGQKVFETFDDNIGWNGTYGNQNQPSDVYVWTLEWVEMRQNYPQQKHLKGEVTLTR